MLRRRLRICSHWKQWSHSRLSLQVIFKPLHCYRPRSEASEGYVFAGVCHSVTGVLYSGKQTDATVIELWNPTVHLLACCLLAENGQAVRIPYWNASLFPMRTELLVPLQSHCSFAAVTWCKRDPQWRGILISKKYPQNTVPLCFCLRSITAFRCAAALVMVTMSTASLLCRYSSNNPVTESHRVSSL